MKAAHEKGPVHAAIEAFLIEKVRQFEARLSQMQTLVSEGQLIEEHPNEMGRSVEELASIVNELGSWCGPSFDLLPGEQQDNAVNSTGRFLLSEGGFEPSEFVRVVEVAKQKARGRPPELRPIALAALETKLQNPGQKWVEIISELCRTRRCGNDSHDNCFKNITREVERLRACLRRYNILPAQKHAS